MMIVDENLSVDTGFDSGASSVPSVPSVPSDPAPAPPSDSTSVYPVTPSTPAGPDSESVSSSESVPPSDSSPVGDLSTAPSVDSDLGSLPEDGSAAVPSEGEETGDLTENGSAAVPPEGDETGDLTAGELPPVSDDEFQPGSDDFSQSGIQADFDSWWGSNLPFTLSVAPTVSPELQLTGVETYQLSPITGANSSGLKKVLLDVIGPYDNIVTQYRYQQNTSTNYTYINEVTPDYPWIASAALFIVLLWSVFRLVGRGMSWMK